MALVKPYKQAPIHYLETKYGFEYGQAKVVRFHHDEDGRVWINVDTPRGELQIHVTPTGFVRTWWTMARKP